MNYISMASILRRMEAELSANIAAIMADDDSPYSEYQKDNLKKVRDSISNAELYLSEHIAATSAIVATLVAPTTHKETVK
jgi:hypothetical protein